MPLKTRKIAPNGLTRAGAPGYSSLHMKTIALAFLALSALSTSAQAEVTCGFLGQLTAEATAGMSDAECVGADHQRAVLTGRQGDRPVLRVVEREYDESTRSYLYNTLAEVRKDGAKALRESCARGLLTARVIDGGKSVLLFYTGATAVRWDLGSGAVTELTTRLKPGTVATCIGRAVGPDAMSDQLIFDGYHRFFVINYGGELSRLSF